MIKRTLLLRFLFFLVNDIVLDWIKNVFHLIDLLLRNIEKLQCSFKVFPCRVILHLSDCVFTVSLFHVSTLILVRSSCYKSNKLFLALSLPGHISGGKIMQHSVIPEHDLIKLFHYSIDRPFATKPLIKRHSCL